VKIAVQCEGTVPGRSCGIENFLYGLLGGLAGVAKGEHELVVSVPKGTRQAWHAALGELPDVQLLEVAATASLPPLARARSLARRIGPLRTIVRGLRLHVETRSLTAIGPDVVYYPWSLGNGAASPAVMTIHDLREEQPEFHDAAVNADRERRVRTAGAIVTSWDHPFAQLRHLYPWAEEKLFLVPLPVLIAPGDGGAGPRASGGEPIVMYAAGTAPLKNHARLVEAFAHVVSQRPARLVCTGTKLSPWYEAALKTARELGIERCVEFTGFLPPAEVVDLYRSAAVVVAPSLWEAASGTVFEGFAYEKPVVCSDIPPIRDQVEFAGGEVRYVDPLDPEDIAEGIVEVLDDPEQLVAGSRRAAAYLRTFTWERTARDYLAVFEWVCAGCPPGERPLTSIERERLESPATVGA
jgi:glycosyltransferase involved in cell wall biosynthesis